MQLESRSHKGRTLMVASGDFTTLPLTTPWSGLLEITPEIADGLLKTNAKNRPISMKTVEKYRALMADSKWQPDIGTPICTSVSGHLLNGQHRLLAITALEMPIIMNVSFGVSENALMFFDDGRPRTTAQNAGLMGLAKPTRTAAAVNMLAAVVMNDRSPGLKAEQVLHFAAENPVALEWFQGQADRTMMKVGYISGAMLLGYPSAPEKVAAFVDAYCTGEGLVSGDPVLALRNHVATHQGEKSTEGRLEMAKRATSALFAYVEGRKLSKISVHAGAVPYFLKAYPEGSLVREWGKK